MVDAFKSGAARSLGIRLIGYYSIAEVRIENCTQTTSARGIVLLRAQVFEFWKNAPVYGALFRA